MIKTPSFGGLARDVSGFLRGFGRNSRGNIAIMAAVMTPVILGTFGIGTEAASWYASKRAMQNAADSAAIAAATNGGSGGVDFDLEARAVATMYGFTNGVGGVTVTALDNQTCPDATTACYSVTISRAAPLLLAQMVGFSGDATVAGKPAKLLQATSVAELGAAPRPYCLVALAGSGNSTGIRTNGAPKADLTGCNVMSNTNADCNGHDLKADFGDAFGNDDGCGGVQRSNVPKIGDQYAGLAANIPADPCAGSYSREPASKHGVPLDPANQFSGYRVWGPVMTVCGDMQLTGPLTVETDTAGSVLYIRNGQLDTNGFTLQTSSGSALTVVFTGTSGSIYEHTPTGGGTLDITAPTKGLWAGVAMYQDPALTENLDISEAGNSPTWDITGLVYLPHASVTFSGAVNKSSSGKSCFVMVVDNVTINGTGSILAHGECAQAGLKMPTNTVPSRGKLVS